MIAKIQMHHFGSRSQNGALKRCADNNGDVEARRGGIGRRDWGRRRCLVIGDSPRRIGDRVMQHFIGRTELDQMRHFMAAGRGYG